MADEPRKVTLDDVVEVLAKHSSAPNDPDDQETLRLFNEQVAEQRSQQSQPSEPQSEKSSTSTSTTAKKG